MDNATEPAGATDRGLVLAYRPDARIETRTNTRTGRPEFRVICNPETGKRADLSAWCGAEERAWQAACLKLGLRLHHP
ncbi:MAG: hypothetical protein JWO38_8318 [Gemmataceae bacterium]|nr:hypothetical protein [Gemmataceae bacterium]